MIEPTYRRSTSRSVAIWGGQPTVILVPPGRPRSAPSWTERYSATERRAMRGQKVAGDKVRLAGEVVHSKFMVLCDSSKGAHAASTSWLQRKGRAVSLRTV